MSTNAKRKEQTSLNYYFQLRLSLNYLFSIRDLFVITLVIMPVITLIPKSYINMGFKDLQK